MQHLHERLKKDLISNFITYLILLSVQLHGGRSYGYKMKLFIEEIIGQTVSEGTLYTLLPRLASSEKYGYLTSYIEETSEQRKRRYYILTDRGEEELEKWTEEWKRTKTTIDNVIEKILVNGVT